MRYLTLLLIAAAAPAAPARYARLGDFEGPVEVQLSAASQWMPAERNLPLPESAWIRTGAAARVEIELDDGNSWRLGPDSQGGLSDYTTLSTGQRITLIAIDRGLAWFAGENRGRDSLALAIPGAQVVVGVATQLRLEAGEGFSQVFVLQGSVNFSSPAAALDLGRRQTARVEPDKPSRFVLDREFEDIELDKWNAARVKALAGPTAALHLAQRYGLADLDASGEWIQTADWGLVWNPKVAATWVPFQNGRWRWYERLGYTWVSDDAWGWLPYHYGRWTHIGEIGWVWSPAATEVFHPGEVYWMRGAKLVGWGPLAPGEDWQPSTLPRWYLDAYTTYATFATDADVIDPAGFDARPKEPLRVTSFAVALPSPALLASRLDAVRPAVRANVLTTPVELVELPPAKPPVKPVQPAPPPPAPVIVVAPPPPPEEVFVPYPVAVAALIYAPILQTPPANVVPPSSRAGGPAQSKPTRPLGRPDAKPGEHGDGKRPHPGEADVANSAFAEIRAQQWRKAADALNQWSRAYAESDFADDRLYYQALVSHYLKEPDRALQFGARVIAKGQDARLDSREMFDLTYLVAIEAAGMNRLNRQQMQLGRAAAQSLLEMTERYFTDANRPAEVKPDAWRRQRDTVETAAHEALKALRAS